MDKNKTSTFYTDNFQLASYLLSKSCRLVSVDKSNPKRAIFIFEDTNQRKALTEKFLSYEAKVEPHRFFSAQKDLKQLLYGEVS